MSEAGRHWMRLLLEEIALTSRMETRLSVFFVGAMSESGNDTCIKGCWVARYFLAGASN